MKRSIVAIAAVMFITSCSNKGFLRQRYTHFGHSSKRTVIVERQAPVRVPKATPEEAAVVCVGRIEPKAVESVEAPAIAGDRKTVTHKPSIKREDHSSIPAQRALQTRSKENGAKVTRDPGLLFFLGDMFGLFNFGPGGTAVSILITLALLILIVLMFA